MSLIKLVDIETDDNRCLLTVREAIAADLEEVTDMVEYLQPIQGEQIIGQLFGMLVLAEHRTKDPELLEQARDALAKMVEAVVPLMTKEDTDLDPGQFQKLHQTLAGCEFTIAARRAVERRQKAMVAAAEEAGIETESPDETEG